MGLTITIGVTTLIDRLKKNRERFIKSYEVLMNAYKKKAEVYQKKYAIHITKKLENKKSKEPNPPPEPEDRRKTYDRYLAMLDIHIETTIKLSEELFNSLWNDKWSWTSQHIRTLTYFADGDDASANALALYAGM